MATLPHSSELVVYIDGSCIIMVGEPAFAGVGVYYGYKDQRNVSMRCEGNQTNQHAELQALVIALTRCPFSQALRIRSDSKFAIGAIENYNKRRIKDWNSRRGTEIAYEDRIRRAVKVYELRKQLGFSTVLEWVKGHSGNAGNDAADELARKGALKEMNKEQLNKAKKNLENAQRREVFKRLTKPYKENLLRGVHPGRKRIIQITEEMIEGEKRRMYRETWSSFTEAQRQACLEWYQFHQSEVEEKIRKRKQKRRERQLAKWNSFTDAQREACYEWMRRQQANKGAA